MIQAVLPQYILNMVLINFPFGKETRSSSRYRPFICHSSSCLFFVFPTFPVIWTRRNSFAFRPSTLCCHPPSVPYFPYLHLNTSFFHLGFCLPVRLLRGVSTGASDILLSTCLSPRPIFLVSMLPMSLHLAPMLAVSPFKSFISALRASHNTPPHFFQCVHAALTLSRNIREPYLRFPPTLFHGTWRC